MKNPLLVGVIGTGIFAGIVSFAADAQDREAFEAAQAARQTAAKPDPTTPNPWPTPWSWAPAFGYEIPGLDGEINLALITFAGPDVEDATRSLVTSADGVTRVVNAPWPVFQLYLARVTRRAIWIAPNAPAP
jgi:hypothetical protein